MPDKNTPSAGLASSSKPAHDSPSSGSSARFSSPVLLSAPSSRVPSRNPSPFAKLPSPEHGDRSGISPTKLDQLEEGASNRKISDDSGNWDDNHSDEEEMPSDLRPSYDRAGSSRAGIEPLLGDKSNGYGSPPRPNHSRRSTFHERDPDLEAKHATRKRYLYASIFLVISLVSFAIQTETAVYIVDELKWSKAYCMLYFTHGSWSLLWPVQLLILRIQKWDQPWDTFWRRHVQSLWQTAQMVQHNTLRLNGRQATTSPVPHMLKMTALVTCALTIAGGSWYVAVGYTTASDLTAIYNCSAFFAYAFSVPLLGEKLKWSKVSAVLIAVAGVLVLAYGDVTPAKHGNQSGGGAGGDNAAPSQAAQNRPIGNLVIGVGSILYGLYEVLYKKLACPPDGCSPGRSMIFANLFGSLIGCFTLSVLWIPLPILHFMGWEEFALPTGKAAWMLAISVLANATFSGSFLVLISLTSPVLSSVAALLTVFIVALLDQFLPEPLHSDLSFAAIVGGCLIIVAFIMLCWASYREIQEERRKKMVDEIEESDMDD